MSTGVDPIARGSMTARNGFANEDFVRNEFNNWQSSSLGQAWLVAMGYAIDEIEYVRAEKLSGYKTDIQVSVSVAIKLKELTDIQNIQVKLISNRNGFNKIDKRRVDRYAELWNMNPDEIRVLKHYTGELAPYIDNSRDSRRMFVDEMSEYDQEILLRFLILNKFLIVSDILKGRGEFHAEWMLVILRSTNEFDWVLRSMNYAMNYFGNGDIAVTKQGNIKIGNITMQRKGGDGGRPSANMLQFKINPAKLFVFRH